MTGRTTVTIKDDILSELKGMKIIPEESYSNVIKRIIYENKELKKGIVPKEKPQIEIKEAVRISQTNAEMKNELENYVLNPEIPDTTPNRHREIWKQTHPNEPLTQDDPIHHINNLHFDNRPENLQKVTHLEHAKIGADVLLKKREETDLIIFKEVTNGHN